MNTTQILLAALLAAVFAPALADEQASPPAPRGVVIDTREITRSAEAARQQALENVRVFSQLGNMSIVVRSKNIKGAPYSAEMVNEQQQNLADGNQIVTRQTTMSYRDGAGRTRQETRDNKGELQLVTIEDAVDGSTYLLHPRNKTATKINRKREIDQAAKDRERAEQARDAAREASKAAAAAAHEAGKAAAAAAREAAQRARDERDRERGERVERSTRIERVDGKETVNVRIEQRTPINVRVEPSVGELANIQTNVNIALAGAFGDARWSHKASTKDLGSKEIDGVKAEGKLRSYEIPAGEVGNRNAIVVSDETWYAPELQVTVYAKHSDPRTGERVFRLANLKREEPAASLFSVPADYTVKDTASEIKRITVEKK
jgi:hypothetical protein